MRKKKKIDKEQNMHDTNEMNKPGSEPDDVSRTCDASEAGEKQEPTLELLQNEIQEWKDKYLRSMAEFDNFRRRSQQEKADWIRLANEKLALSICDVVDNFERALSQVGEEHRQDSYIKGFYMIEQQLVNVLEKEGIKKIDALNQEFDPKYHEALAHIPSEHEENMIAAVIQNGYIMFDKVIRPARVAVSNGKSFNTEE